MPIDNNSHEQLERRLQDIDWDALRRPGYTPSPAAWEDQVLYFLMLDRFSDGREQGYRDNSGNLVAGGSTPPFRFPDDAYTAERASWADAGDEWLGGTLKGLERKIGYLKRLGVTAVWVSPMFKQVVSDTHSYHGYGIQNFLDVDPHFGTRQDLIDLVNTAHEHGIRVILDIILNHSGNVFGYQYNPNRYPAQDEHGNLTMDARWDGGTYPVAGWRNAFGETNLPFGPIDPASHGYAWPNDAVWPAEMQQAENFTRKGRIDSWDNDPEYFEGDFVTLKDIRHGEHERDAYNNRIVDAFHVAPALTALCEVYKFWIALADIDGFRIDTVKHMEPGATRYFAAVIQVRKGNDKGRFCGDRINNGYMHLKAVLGLNLCAMGIPCVYYGTEQAFDGAGNNDRYLRECMFGGAFGSLQSTGRHFFDENHEIYRFIADVTALRNTHLALRRGRQYLREISDSGDFGTFGLPRMIGGQIRSVVPWSRLFDDQEIVLAINTDADNARAAWVTIDATLHSAPGALTCLYSSNAAQIGSTTPVEARNGRAIRILVPAGGFVMYR